MWKIILVHLVCHRVLSGQGPCSVFKAVKWAVVLLSSHSVEGQGPAESLCGGLRCHKEVRGCGMQWWWTSSYVAKWLDGTGFSSRPCQTVPHGGRSVGGGVERVLFSQRQHHGIRLREQETVEGLHFWGKYEGSQTKLYTHHCTLVRIIYFKIFKVNCCYVDLVTQKFKEQDTSL